MSKVKWTKEQQDAIYEKNKNILVAAAAGSGKTAVLVERIINKILYDKIDIDKLLVVTFTNSAASEMRERVLNAIYKELEENPEDENLQRQITLLNQASICTIDSFCLEVVRNNFYELENISPNFRIADTTEIELLKQEVIEDIFEEKYETQDEDFAKLINVYTSYRDDTPLKEIVLKIDSYIQSNPFPQKWLEEKIEMFNLATKLEEDFRQTPWGKILLQEVEEELIDDITILEQLEKDLSYDLSLEKFYQTIRNDKEQLQNLINNLDNWDKAYEIAKTLKFVTWPRQKIESQIKEKAKEARDEVKRKLAKVLDKILICDSRQANQDIYDMYPILLKLQDLILNFQKEFTKQKREKNIVDFSDVEHLALTILLDSEEVAKKYQNKFQEIAIDEYQDSNLVQEYILTAISRNNNIFMVGDVKQSIYKFRQAMPELFLNKYETYQKKEIRKPEEDLKIQLFKNFRSKETILQFTNLIFEDIMSKMLGDIDYKEEEFLNLGANYPKMNQNEKIEINIIDPLLVEDTPQEADKQLEEKIEETTLEEEENIADVELEAKLVANKIKKMIESKYQVWDKKQECYRDICYKDMVILLRSTSKVAPIYEQEILKLQMPVFSDSSQEYLDSIEIQTIMSLLKIIDNPIQDIPLVAVMRSNIGKFTDDELIQIRLADKQDSFYTCLQKAKLCVDNELKQKIENFLACLKQWRKEQEYLALDELIWKIYTDTGYYNYVGLMPNGSLRQANLKVLFERAKQYETASFKGLYHFIRFIEKLRLNSGDMGSAKIIGENDDVIRIMSIHKSKGLEFPIVFLASTGKQFNLMDLNQNILLHQELGIGAKYIDYEKQVQYDTLSKAAIRNQTLTETLSEEMRILYVALTRAKEKLIVTGIKKDYEKQKEKLLKQIERYPKQGQKINSILVKKYIKFMDWMLLVYFYEPTKMEQIAQLNTYTKKQVLDFCEKVEVEEVNMIQKMETKELSLDTEEFKKIVEILNHKYRYQLSTKIPTKSSVTKIKQAKQETIEINFGVPKFMKKEEDTKLTASQKGTLLHLCLQKIDERKEYNLETIGQFINNLVEKEMITTIEAKNINPSTILKFRQSNIWQELKQAKEIQKEKPFYITIPAKEIYQEDVLEDILVQGIIDLYYINKKDELVLVDYKTDFVSSEKELINRYTKQLELYQKALEEALQKKVSRVLIYSTFLGKELEVLKN
ncbi:MAG: helicase-exonuclease AddAB subunit AddA [Clostridia bacterium]|nr:helicase-exonuclease AddAB subunit AddA [Clostridia bacterium]